VDLSQNTCRRSITRISTNVSPVAFAAGTGFGRLWGRHGVRRAAASVNYQHRGVAHGETAPVAKHLGTGQTPTHSRLYYQPGMGRVFFFFFFLWHLRRGGRTVQNHQPLCEGRHHAPPHYGEISEHAMINSDSHHGRATAREFKPPHQTDGDTTTVQGPCFRRPGRPPTSSKVGAPRVTT